MYIKKHLKKRLAISIISVMILTVTLTASSYALFMDFKYNTNDQIIEVGDLQITYREGTGTINLINIKPVTDNEGLDLNNNTYAFTIENTGNLAYHYTISLKDNPNYGVTNPLLYHWIRYKLNNNSINTLDQLEANKIFEGILNPGTEESFNLQIWVGSGHATDATIGLPNEVLGSKFHLEIVVDGRAGASSE